LAGILFAQLTVDLNVVARELQMTTPSSSSPELTQLLIDWSRRDQTALTSLMPLVYEELHRLAIARFAESVSATRCKPPP
jgi:hypothetical protein